MNCHFGCPSMMFREFSFWTVAIIYFFSDDSFHEAGYFRTLSRRFKLVVGLVKFSQLGENGDSRTGVLRTMDEIRFYKAEVILLYLNKENMEFMLNQVSKWVDWVRVIHHRCTPHLIEIKWGSQHHTDLRWFLLKKRYQRISLKISLNVSHQ